MKDFECEYCGHQFDQQYYWNNFVVCPVCKETKMIKDRRDEDHDVYGYKKEKKGTKK